MCDLLLAPKQIIRNTEAVPRGVLLKRYSANPQQIYSIAHMKKCYATSVEITFQHEFSPAYLLYICRTRFRRKAMGDCF